MDKPVNPRRDFLKRTAVAMGGTWMATHMPSILAAAVEARATRPGERAWTNLAAREALELGAVVDQIYPPDEESPGATELGVVRFMDISFGGFMAGALTMVRAGLAELELGAVRQGKTRFSELKFDEQRELLERVQETPFFTTLHFLTLCGAFCVPEQGGNRDGAGWQQLGFEPRFAWQPPFGWYDETHHGEQDDVGP